MLRELRETADVVLKVKKIEDPVIAVWTDSGLFGARGEQMDEDYVVPPMNARPTTHREVTLLLLYRFNNWKKDRRRLT